LHRDDGVRLSRFDADVHEEFRNRRSLQEKNRIAMKSSVFVLSNLFKDSEQVRSSRWATTGMFRK
jgi:hypothetical protein